MRIIISLPNELLIYLRASPLYTETVEHIQALIKEGKELDRVVETPIYEYA